jgi:hypothetical protein
MMACSQAVVETMKRLSKILILTAALMLIAGLVLLRAFSDTEAPQQPIEYSHWQHVTKEDGPRLECNFCHEHADKSAHATIPNVSTCMLCHENIKADSPEVQKLAAIAARGQQPAWVRVYWFEKEANTYFTHKPHLRAEISCQECHGDIGQMQRVRRAVDQNMGWCIDCHAKRSVSNDCYICHR